MIYDILNFIGKFLIRLLVFGIFCAIMYMAENNGSPELTAWLMIGTM